MQNVSLKKVMLNAYGIPDDREYTIDGPDFLTAEHFDIEATFPANTPVPKVREMMQTMRSRSASSSRCTRRPDNCRCIPGGCKRRSEDSCRGCGRRPNGRPRRTL